MLASVSANIRKLGNFSMLIGPSVPPASYSARLIDRLTKNVLPSPPQSTLALEPVAGINKAPFCRPPA